MIRRFIPTLLLLLLGLLCALACVGALTAAAIAWLTPYWGPALAGLAVAGFYLVAALVAVAIARLRHSRPHGDSPPSPQELLDRVWEAKPITLMAVAGLTVFLLAKKPSFVTRIIAAGARSTAAVAMLKKLL